MSGEDRPSGRRAYLGWLGWCGPALLAAVLLRAALCTALPFGYFHYDTHDFLVTPDHWLSEGEWKLHKKKVPLVPAMYTAAAVCHAPLLRAVPALQHAGGVALVLLFALLLRKVCPSWRAMLVPATVLLAVQPAVLWYEHALLAESLFLVFVVAAAAATALYLGSPGWRNWLLLLAALALAALTRPEGKILFMVAPLALAAAHARQPRALAAQGGALAALLVFLLPASRTSQTGLMPLASVIHWMPDKTRAAAGAEPLLLPIRAQARALQGTECHEETETRKALSNAVREFFTQNPDRGDPKSDRRVNQFCRRLALEIFIANWWRAPALAFEKVLMTIDMTSCGRLDADTFEREMPKSLGRDWGRVLRLSQALSGLRWTDEAAALGFVADHYRAERCGWFNALLDGWQSAVSWPKHPPRPSGAGGLLALPAGLLVAMAGAVIACLRPGPMRAFHLCWVPALGTLGFAVFAVAGIEARFRFVFEPFVILYAAVAVGVIASACGRWLTARREREASVRESRIDS